MPVPSIVVDGAHDYGTPIVTINGTAYKLNNISLDRPFSKAMDRDEKGRPQRQRWTADVATMTGEIQLSPGTSYPKFGDEFTVTLDTNYGAETYVIMPLPINYTNGEGDIRVGNFTAEKRISATSVTLVT